MMFELIEKHGDKEVTTRTNNLSRLLCTMIENMGNRAGSVGGPEFSGARGEIEVGISGGPQLKLRVKE